MILPLLLFKTYLCLAQVVKAIFGDEKSSTALCDASQSCDELDQQLLQDETESGRKKGNKSLVYYV